MTQILQVGDIVLFDKNDDRIGGGLTIPYTAFEQSFTTF